MSGRRHRRRRDPDSAANRLYLKKGGTWFADFRDIGAGCKSMGTTDEFTAAARVQETFDAIKAEQAKAEAASDEPTLQELKPHYLKWQLVGRGRPRRPETVASDERRLQKLIDHFGPDKRLADFTPDMIEGYVAMRRQQAGRKAPTVAIQTVLHEVHALSGLIKWAILKGRYSGEYPFTKVELPEVVPVEQEYLEAGEAARFLSAAEAGDPFWSAVFAFFLYTGCRNQELRSRLVADVDFEGGWVRIHPNDFYQLKSKHAKRRIPLWPALRRVLQEYLGGRTTGLLFPSPVNGGMLSASFVRPIERVMEELARRDQAIPKNVTPHTFRHSYTSARVQTLDHGAPVSVFTVACELGHRDTGLIERVYGHLTKVPNRAETVEYLEADVVSMKEEATA